MTERERGNEGESRSSFLAFPPTNFRREIRRERESRVETNVSEGNIITRRERERERELKFGFELFIKGK